MTESLSQDELDALLSNFADDASAPSESYANLTSDAPVSDPALAPVYAAAEAAFRNGAEGIGVMLAARSGFSRTGEETFLGRDAAARFKDEGLIIELPIESPQAGSIFLRMSEEQSKALIAAATSTDPAEVMFSDDQTATVAEIINPALVAVSKAFSSRIRSPLTTGQTAAYLLSASNPFHEEMYHEISGILRIEGIAEDSVSLIIPVKLAADIKKKEIQAESDSGHAERGSQSHTPDKKPYSKNNLNLLLDVQMPLTVELGRTKMYVKEILSLGEGSILELDKLASEPVDLMVNAKLIAKGEVIVIDENFGVRVTDIVSPTERLRMGSEY